MQYKEELFAQKTPYLQWLMGQEAGFARKYGKRHGEADVRKDVCRLPFSSCMDSMQEVLGGLGEGDFQADCADSSQVYLFFKKDGVLSPYAEQVFLNAFVKNRRAVFAYADEDYRGGLEELYGIGDGEFEEAVTQPYRFGGTGAYRGEPWFKPDFSPDTLESFFYIGGIFAVRGDLLGRAVRQHDPKISLYEFVYTMLMGVFEEASSGGTGSVSKKIVHIPKVLYTNDSLIESRELPGAGALPACRADEAGGKVSIIIPSKDNADVLETCIGSLLQYTNYKNYELIVVDNGSCGEQKKRIKKMVSRFCGEHGRLSIKYLYGEMDFNFSKMCNRGARAARGEYLLFLNDDTEVMDTEEGRNWLTYMVGYASKKHVGAVGAKLYYPKEAGENTCYRIQHAGITNMGVGPVHKLGGMEDKGCLYHGHNTVTYDMLAVTAACMLVRRTVFQEVKGFGPKFAVAYNDVDLCFRLYGTGRYNVQVNKAVLIHHESLSRGQDTSAARQGRLAKEKKKLYKNHASLKGRDPFYSPNLVQWKKDAAYNACYRFPFDKPMLPRPIEEERRRDVERQYRRWLAYTGWASQAKGHGFGAAGKRALAKVYGRLHALDCPTLTIDSVEYEGKMAVIKGWYVLQEHDNACLDKSLLLIRVTRDEGYFTVYEFADAPQLREDVALLFAALEKDKGGSRQTANTMLSGIHLVVDVSRLKEGTYILGVLARSGREDYSKCFAVFSGMESGKLVEAPKKP